MKRAVLFITIILTSISNHGKPLASEIYYASQEEHKVNISEKGKSDVQINTSDMKAGIYMYSLIVDNKLINTRRMIVSD